MVIQNVWFKIMIGLFYPAFLGSFIYNVADKFDCNSLLNNWLRYIIFIEILLLFIMDYLYTDNDEYKKNYNIKQFIMDFLLIIISFYLIKIILDFSTVSTLIISILLAISKFINLFWEFLSGKEQIDIFSRKMYFIFGLFYCFSCFFTSFYFIGFILLIDIFLHCYYSKAKELFK